ncbi:MAG: alkaline phosphatase family protein [Lentisphaerae bacterium]|nr:alkaline phosphatase family protein [Lentisphaerota bacterium]
MKPRTLLIALDGADFRVLDPLMQEGVMPFLKAFAERGVRADLLSSPHPLTPPSFSTMVTGRSPGHHGIFDFVRGEDKGRGVFFTLYSANDLRCETVWSIADRQGLSSTALNFVMTSPVTPVRGYVVPGMVQWKHLRRHVHPPAFYETLKTFPWFHPRSMCWDFDHIGKAIVGDYQTDSREWIRHHIERESQWFHIATHIMEHDPTDLFSIVFDGTDKLQHICWEYLDPAFFPEQPGAEWQEARRLTLEYFRELDGYLRGLVERAGPDSRVFIVSDHGFGPAHLTFRVNQFLCNLGHLAWRDRDKSLASGEKEFQLDLDWEKTVAYCATRSSNGVFIRVARRPGDPGIPPDRYQAFRDELIAAFRGVKDPETGLPVVRDILVRDEFFAGPAMDLAPDLTLVLDDYGMVWTSPGDRLVEHKRQIKGTHHPLGVFLAAGAGLREGETLEKTLTMEQIAPTLLYSLDLPIPENFESPAPAPVFAADRLQARPPRLGPPAWEAAEGSGDTAASAPAATDEEEKAVYDQLRALGYME